MDDSERQTALQSFCEDPECTVLVANYNCADVGLNLQVAGTVIHYEASWNPGWTRAKKILYTMSAIR